MKNLKQTELWEILVPHTMNKKVVPIKHHWAWDEKVRNVAGGLTIQKPTKGYWTTNDNIIVEKMIPVKITCSKKEIIKIAAMTLRHYEQQAIMFYKISECVMMIGTPEALLDFNEK